MYMFYSKKKKPKIYDSQAKCQTFINGVKENSYKSYHVMDEIKITYNLFTKHTKKKITNALQWNWKFMTMHLIIKAQIKHL